MKIYFTIVVFLRTDKDSSSGGHPVDRVQLDDFIAIDFLKERFEANHSGYLEFTNFVDIEISRKMRDLFQNSIVHGKSKPCNTLSADGLLLPNGSEYHYIRVSDIRNVVVLEATETIQKTFEEVYEFSL
jgi:hypothetical protein